MSSGSVYVLANSSMPGLVKVGRTTRDPKERAAELSSATGLPTPFIVVYDHHFDDCTAAEQFAHAYLEGAGYRLSANREFFSAPTSEVVKALTAFTRTVAGMPAIQNDATKIVRELADFWYLLHQLIPADAADIQIVSAFSEFVSASMKSEPCNAGDVLIIQSVSVFAAAIRLTAIAHGWNSEISQAFSTFEAAILKLEPVIDEDFVDSFQSDDAGNFDPHTAYRSTPWFPILEQAERLFEGDEYTPSDYFSSLRLFKQSARLGAISAHYMIARMYANGNGVTVNERSQMRWLTEGANKGCFVCYWGMSLLFAKQGDISNARRAFVQFMLDVGGRDRTNGQFGDVEWRRLCYVWDDCVMMLFYRCLAGTTYDPMYDTYMVKSASGIRQVAQRKLLNATTNGWKSQYCKAFGEVVERLEGLEAE